ncbi:MAG: 2-nitropropane dioxygenase [Acidimicrobiales bacterium]|nr:2-nitropropane dioxygenase [Acidimicrobiales bacterium]
MGGGPTTTDLVVATAAAGALPFLPAGYKTASTMQADIDAVRAATDAAFGVNLFVPQGPGDPEAIARYLTSLAPDAERLDTRLGEPSWDDDDYDAKVDGLLRNPPAAVSFTFGCPEREVVDALRAAGAVVAVTVTSPGEATAAVTAGADCLCVQGREAGAHRGSFTNDIPDEVLGILELVRELKAVTDLPLIAAGGIVDGAGVAEVLRAGAVAAQVGTAFLRCPESGAHAVYKEALGDPRFTTTAFTRAFSGRPARGLVNQFMLDHPEAPAAYPEINNATRPLRAAAAAAGDPDRLSLWAGENWRRATARPAGEVVERLGAGASGM